MATLDIENKLLTVIVLFRVKQDQQADVVDRVKELFAIAKQQPGFISANLHRSLDDIKVANYAQWKDAASLAQFQQLPEVQQLIEPLQELIEEMDSHRYEIVASESKVGTPQIRSQEYFVHSGSSASRDGSHRLAIRLEKNAARCYAKIIWLFPTKARPAILRDIENTKGRAVAFDHSFLKFLFPSFF
ncbi:MAG: antibiotic biosynthesis monooxygenase family protein [Cyanobacteria bacterium J06627_32]